MAGGIRFGGARVKRNKIHNPVNYEKNIYSVELLPDDRLRRFRAKRGNRRSQPD